MPRVRVIKVPVKQQDSRLQSADVPQSSREVYKPAFTPAHQAAPVPSNSVSISKSSLKKTAIMLAVLFLVVLFFVITSQDSDTKKDRAPAASQNTPQSEAEKYHRQVSAIAEVPGDQVPSMIPIDQQDAGNLVTQNPELFKNAMRGDVILLYTKQQNDNKSALFVLYRPASNKVVTMIEVNKNAQSSDKR